MFKRTNARLRSRDPLRKLLAEGGTVEFRRTALVFAVVVGALWILDPGGDQAVFGSYFSACIVWSTWLNARGVPLWFESVEFFAAFVALAAWRIVGLPLGLGIGLGLGLQVAGGVAYSRSDRVARAPHDDGT
jgi:hypothetical protein